ncbi:ribonuclease H-like domain-containing protein [Tanacetum coccineum]
MSEAEPIPPTSSVTALRIPMIKKGEYDLWSMKMRQYIAITDHILWDIITNGNQATTDPASSSVSAPKTSLAANARRNNEKALNILLSAIPDRHLLSFHDAEDARTLWSAIKARFGGNEASKKMQKNLLKQQFETFTIGSREELDSAYERFQNILSMLELYDAKVSQEDANLKFLRSLPSVWHVVATMIRGQPGLDELEFDDLYNNLKVYEHELKGVSNSSSQNIAFLSTEVKGSTLKQNEIICSFFAQQASMPTTHDDEDLLQIDEDAMEEIDIRWQVAMITARIRKFMRKTGRPIDLKPKNGITFDKHEFEHEHVALRQEDLVILTGATKLMKHQSTLALMANKLRGTLQFQIMEYDIKIRDLKLEEKTKELIKPEKKEYSRVLVMGIESENTSGHTKQSRRRSQRLCLLLTLSDALSIEFSSLIRSFLSYPPKFKYCAEDLVILRAPRKNDVYSLDLKNIIPSGGITCLVAKATKDEAFLWHRRLGHVNFKNIKKLVKGNLLEDTFKTFKIDHTSLSCRKGKPHMALLARRMKKEQSENLQELLI